MKYRLLGNNIWGIEMGFPYYLYSKEMTRGLAYGGMRDRIIA